jgi:ABC-type nickel/cobalt efflux system permease component RcnA
MGIWLELGIFGLVFVFAFWQMHDVRKAQEQTRQQRAREKAAKEAQETADHSTDATNGKD